MFKPVDVLDLFVTSMFINSISVSMFHLILFFCHCDFMVSMIALYCGMECNDMLQMVWYSRYLYMSVCV